MLCLAIQAWLCLLNLTLLQAGAGYCRPEISNVTRGALAAEELLARIQDSQARGTGLPCDAVTLPPRITHPSIAQAVLHLEVKLLIAVTLNLLFCVATLPVGPVPVQYKLHAECLLDVHCCRFNLLQFLSVLADLTKVGYDQSRL